MALEIEWSNEAEKQLDEVIKHIENRWTEKELNSFFSRLEQSLEAIQKNPNTYKNSQRQKGVKEFLVHPHNTIFYTFDKTKIHIISFWSNRMFLDKEK